MATPKIGDKVTYFCWHGGDAGDMRAFPATITNVYPETEPLLADLEVELDEEVEASGIIRTQTESPERTRMETDIYAAGTWTTDPSRFPAQSTKPPAAAQS